MKITKEINCSCNIRASFNEDGSFQVFARSRAQYAPDEVPEAVVGAMVEVAPEYAARIKLAMDEALEAHHADLARQVDHNAAIAYERARELGEVGV